VTVLKAILAAGEAVPWPDAMTRIGIAWLVGRTRDRLASAPADADLRFAEEMSRYPIATHVAAANTQHYELPQDFFAHVLGPQRKYSCCLYDHTTDTLATAEERALCVTAERAGLGDGQRILDLGCGWGSLSLWMAKKYPSSRIVAVSNSRSQREFIVSVARALALSNMEVLTADMNEFAPPERFDRIVSVEMFEHMANWRPLLRRLRDCLEPDGRMFIHVFSNRRAPYRFATDEQTDWIAQYFFSGGLMPSHSLIRQFGDCFAVENEWQWNGGNYARTAEDWLKNFDSNTDKILAIFERVYGADARLWRRRWRLFFLATAGLFGFAGGEEWGVSHYRLAPVLS
jgi:cyclopropane-fatty-acyl-phospholipid synthase